MEHPDAAAAAADDDDDDGDDDADQSRSTFPQMSSRTGQSELLRVDEVLDKAAENANEPKTASNKAVIWKGHGNANL